MRRHDKQHFANIGELKISLQLTIREIEKDNNSGQVTLSYIAKLI
jgi:hypothetical protein